MISGKTTVTVMAERQNADLFVVDVGIKCDMSATPEILNRKIRFGTANFIKEPAMAREEAIKAIEAGIGIACDLSEKGYKLIATGEMGIGNTTTSSAVTAVLLGCSPDKVTGRGSGLSTEGLHKKINVIEEGIRLHKPDKDDVLDILSKVGGLDIAGLCGVFLGCAASRVPALADGFISSAAALCAVRLCPGARDYIFASHLSKEPAAKMLLDALDVPYYLDCDMCLGEGTGAVLAFPVFDMAAFVYREMCSFEDLKIPKYVPMDENE
jgi:nicotinate-nucleotide--dimethylbenzimidazole phosphoribosyltransferase